MNKTITIEKLKPEQIDQCRELCNELMKYQKSQAIMAPERFDMMNFDTRMKPSYDSALEKEVLIVRDKGVPIGYAFYSVESVEETLKAPANLLPDWEDLPEKTGHLNNFYLKPEYRGQGLGKKLFQLFLEWVDQFEDVNLLMIHVSNGNKNAYNFYTNHGFTFSHDVAGGFIQALYRWKE